MLQILYGIYALTFLLHALSGYFKSYWIFVVSCILTGIFSSPLPSIMESIISAAFKGVGGFALAMRNSLEQFAKVIILLIIPAIYNWKKEIWICQLFLFILTILGFIITFGISKLNLQTKITEIPIRCSEILKIPKNLIWLIILLTCSFTLSMAFNAFLAAYAQKISGFSNQTAGYLLVFSLRIIQ